MRERWKAIARIVSTHAKSGEVVVNSVHGLPPLMESGLEVAVVPPPLKGSRYLRIKAAGQPSSTSQLVSFEGVNGIAEAKELVGKTVLARMEDLPQDIAFLDKEALVGMEAYDVELGLLGRVVEVMAGPEQDVLVLERAGRELLVPVRREFVRSVGKSMIDLELPQGCVSIEGEG